MRSRSLLIVLILTISGKALAAPFQIDATLLGQGRENEKQQREVPINGYFGGGFAKTQRALSFRTDMRYARDVPRLVDDYDLYQAVAHIEPISTLHLDAGRQFVAQGFSADIIDGARVALVPAGKIGATVYSGIPRTVERGDFNQDDGLLTGLSVGLQNVARTNAQLHAAWRKNRIRRTDLTHNDDIVVGTSLSHQWMVAMKPTLYGVFEYNVAAKVIDTGTFGVDLLPSRRLAVNLEFNQFDVNRSEDRPSILALISQGRLFSGRLSSAGEILPHWILWRESYSYQSIEIQSGVRRNGHVIDTSLPITFETIGLSIEPGYIFEQSFGGRVHAIRCVISEEVTEKFFVGASVDFATYSKITNDNDQALSTELWGGYTIFKDLSLSAGFEYNRNNLLDRDIRGTLKLAYHYGHES